MKHKVVIIGCGNVGMSYAYALINQRTYVNRLVLIDINKERTEGDFTGRNPRSDERVYRESTRTAINKMETHNFERNSNRNGIRFTCNTALDKIVALSYLLQNKRYNQDRPRITIRSFRSLSKQAQREWLNKHRYSSSFNWDDELEM